LKIADLMEVQWGQMLVKRDPVSEVVGVGVGGADLIRPAGSSSRDKPNTGVVIKAGPEAPYSPGDWAVFAEGSFTDLAMGSERDVILLDAQYVLAWVPGHLLPIDINQEDILDYLMAPLGYLLTERAEMPISRGRIIIPDGINLHTRSSEARVVACSSAESPFKSGDDVFLAGSVSKSILCGKGRRVWLTKPRQIPARILAHPEEMIEKDEAHTVGMHDFNQAINDSPGLDEGDRRLPQ
jgi:hypothetical protein